MLAIRYTLFAIISTLFNLLFQYLSISVYSGYGSLYVAMAWGTLAGLIVKYILDKKYIFNHVPRSMSDDARKFLLYSFMGVFTTLIFWGTEILFHMTLDSPAAKYVGGAVGLAIGYVVKYFLDKHFVFVHRDALS